MDKIRMRGKTELVFAAAVLFLLYTQASAASPWRDDRPITVGHRGTTILEDENTIAAFKLAHQYGIDVFECDPRLTADGVYVIMHDSTVDRTTDGTGKVAEMTLEQVKELRTESGHLVPTLAEALDFALEHNMGVYLDLKEIPEDGGELLVQTIEDAGMTEMVIAGCYEIKTLKMIEEQEPAISTCIAWPYPALTMGMAKRLGADAVGTLKQLASPLAVWHAHKKGLYIITMPINDPKEIEKFTRRGLDAIQTDDPTLVGEE